MGKAILYISFLFFVSCMGNKTDFKSPAGYDLARPEKFSVPEALDEISGICFHNGKSDTLYAEQDEDGKVYYLHLGDKKASHTHFGKGGDYEDMAILNEQVFVLRSDGTLFSFPFNEVRSKEVADVKEWDQLLPDGEFEGICADPKTNQLYVLCKHCQDDETTKAITVYILQLQPDGNIVQGGSASVNVRTIETLTKEKKIKFHPSALGRDPVKNQFYLVSAVNKMLVITDKDWNVKEVYPLDPTLFRQAEGIAFDDENNLYISNEGDGLSKGNVLKFAYKKKN